MLKYGYENDIWFHVDSLSSAHVYLRLQGDWTFDNIPPAVLTDCCQLVKANSIEGNKKNNVRIVYTPFNNLKKEQGHDVGQVTFHTTKLLKYVTVDRRVNEIVNRLNKTKEEKRIDWMEDKNVRLQEEKKVRKDLFEMTRTETEKEAARRKDEVAARSYDKVLSNAKMTTNKDVNTKNMSVQEYEENFF